MTLIAEDLLLLLLEEATGTAVTSSTRLDHALGGAVLLELAQARRVGVTEKQGWLRQRVLVTDPAPTGDGVLDDALIRLRAKERDPQTAVLELSTDLRPALLARLVSRGVLRREDDRVLWIFPRERWPAVDPSHGAALRRRLHDVLVTGLSADPRTGALLALLGAIDQAHKVTPGGDRRAVRARARAVTDRDWVGSAVRRVVRSGESSV